MRAAQSCWSEISVGFEFPLSLALQKRVDNLGAYRIPSETGFLIPSDCDSYFRFARDLPATLPAPGNALPQRCPGPVPLKGPVSHHFSVTETVW
jgi:hypothetical protein